LPPGLKARAGSGADAALQALWRAGFAGLARLRPTSPGRWASAGGSRVLAVAAHPDDEVAGCAGTLLRHREAGDAVTVAVATDGRRSRAGGRGPDEMAATRRREAEAVAARIDVELRWLGLPEGEWREDALREGLGAALDLCSPTVVYAPSVVDFHPEHVAVARSLATALAVGSPQRLRVYPVQVPLTSVLVNLVSPVGDRLPAVAEAIETYASQSVSLRRCLRARAYAGARHGLAEAAEEFWEMTADDYRRLQPGPPGALSRFRGLRHHALGDPLAYLAGRDERRRLRDRACGGAT
jgi:LmbE family N-acetylglucosaminyl deacetylase